MSRRTAIYRHLQGSNVGETVNNILSSHGNAKDSGRQWGRAAHIVREPAVCSRPMSQSKALRIAGALHRSRS